MHINKKDIAAYALLPQVFPRFKDLFASGFQWFASLVAYIYYAVRLLPAGHPYLKPENKGKYGLRHVIAAAAQNLKFDLKHVDQLLIFGVVIAGVVLLLGQVFLLIFGFVFSRAQAGLFETQFPQSDNAFMLLDYVFGVPGIFGSCALGDRLGATIAPCNNIPNFGDGPAFAFHAGLHSLLEFYSWSLLFVGILIFLYFIVVVTAETASTGVPFGARFNTVWAPIRLLVAIGLLLPVAYGLNSGQYITLGIAKLGSGLATNAWWEYNDAIANQQGYQYPNPVGMGNTNGNLALLPEPRLPDISPYLASFQVVMACRYGYMKQYGYGTTGLNDVDNPPILPWAVKPGATPIPLMNTAGTSALDASGAAMSGYDAYESILHFFDYGDITVTFGRPRLDEFGTVPDPVEEIEPLCGEITFVVTTPIAITNGGGDAGAWAVQKRYYDSMFYEWSMPQNRAFAALYGEELGTGMAPWFRPCMVWPRTLLMGTNFGFDELTVLNFQGDSVVGGPGCDEPPTVEEKTALYTIRQGLLEAQVKQAWVDLQTATDLYPFTNDMRERGWAAAGMWYNNISAVIGREFDAVRNIPYMSKFPAPMEEVRKIKQMHVLNVFGPEIYNPVITKDESSRPMTEMKDYEIASTLYEVYNDWYNAGINMSNLSIMGDKNVLTGVMHGIFGTRSLASIRDEEFRDVHPMAILVAIGKDLVNSTLFNVLTSTGFAVAGGIYEVSGASFSAGAASALSSAFSSIALVGLTAGFLLYYVLPFMPFLYFFFAVGTWIKTIFEAMVGVPLWALAHIRIDREGLPGDAAANGYFLMLEILIRPILCVFGLVASFIIFGALVRVLHEIFDLVVDNAMGFDDQNLNVNLGVFTLTLDNKRQIIDEFFFTIIYVLMVYVIGLSCFKLIDMIPNSILRWAGAGVKSFGDTYQDPAEGLTQYAAIGGYVVGERAMGGIRQAGTVMGQGIGAAGGRLPTMFPNEVNVIKQSQAAKKG
jgi:hypothetical protein